MNPPRSFYRTSSNNIDNFEDKLLQNDSNKPHFPFLANKAFHMKQRRSTHNHAVGDGVDHLGMSMEKNLFLQNDKGNISEEELLKNVMASSQKWANKYNAINDIDEDDNNYEENDYNGSFSKNIFEKFSPGGAYSKSPHQSVKDEEVDTLSDVLPGDLPEESPLFKSNFFEKSDKDKFGINFLMLLGLLVALLASKCLQYLQLYMEWFKGQVVQLRSAFLDDANPWEVFDFDKNARFSLRSKLIMMPVIMFCGLLNCVINMMHFSIRVMLAPAPRGLTQIVRKLSADTN